MKKIVITCVVLFLMSFLSEAFAQTANPSYKTSVGIKFFPMGLTIKSMSGKNSAFEFLGYFNDGFRVTVLSEHFGSINQANNLKWFIGAGGHAGLADQSNGGSAKLGIDGIIGIDYKFLHLPLNLSLDWQPSVGFGDQTTYSTNWGGIGVRYCF